MNILGTIIIGSLIGLIALFIRPANDKMGQTFTVLVGIIGAFVGQFLGQALGAYNAYGPAGVVGAVIGAVLVLALLRVTYNQKLTR